MYPVSVKGMNRFAAKPTIGLAISTAPLIYILMIVGKVSLAQLYIIYTQVTSSSSSKTIYYTSRKTKSAAVF